MSVSSTTNSILENIDLNQIPPFSSQPIRTVPLYVFGNCNQVTCNKYHPDQLKHLREKALPHLNSRS
jgi:hypothetical protein